MSITQYINNELFALGVSWRTILRNYEKYTSVVVKSYLMWVLDITNKRIRFNQWIRMAYAFWREIDDIIDGDKRIPNWFIDWNHFLDSLIDDINNDKPNTRIWLYANCIINDFKKIGYDLTIDLKDFIQWMRTEYNRREHKRFLSENELVLLHNQSFRWPQQIYLSALWSQYSVGEIGELPQILWWIYGLKDFIDDYNKNIYNIPKEVIEKIWNTNLKDILESDDFDNWVISVVNKQKENLKILQEKILKMDNWVKVICNWLLPEIIEFFNDFSIIHYKNNLLNNTY